MQDDAKTIRRGFNVPCPKCGETGKVQIFLDDVTSPSGEHFSCDGCGQEWSGEDIRSLVGVWSAALAWLDTAPPLTEE